MKELSLAVEIISSPDKVFAMADDINKTGWHMTKNSMPMMGSRLNLEIKGSTYRWFGSVMGLKMDFSETVTEWIKDSKKAWITIGKPRMIIMDSYEMGFTVEKKGENTLLTYYIKYELPKFFLNKILGFLLADYYSRWCLGHMCHDIKNAVESLNSTTTA